MKQLTRPAFLLPVILVLTSTSATDKIDFACNSEEDIFFTRQDSHNVPPLEYAAPKTEQINEEITGKLHHDLVLTGGRCFDLKLWGRKGKDYIEIDFITQPTDFKTLHLCQDIPIERHVEYNKRNPYQYKQGDVQVGEGAFGIESAEILARNGLTCYHRVW